MSNKKNKILSELFHDGIINDLKVIMKSSSNNIIKSEAMIDYLKPHGFKREGCGTNILVVTHKKKYKDLVFKIALDSYGIKDNYVDIEYSDEIKQYVTVYETHRTGMVSVHDKVRIIKNHNEAKRYYPQMRKLLNELKEDYILCDLSLRTFKNFGLVKGKNGKYKLVLADGSDLVRIRKDIKLSCPNKLLASRKGRTPKFEVCGGKLKYDEEFYELVCQDCGKAYNPTELYQESYEEVNVLKNKFFSLGMDDRQVKQLNLEIIKAREAKNVKYPELDLESEELDDEEENNEVEHPDLEPSYLESDDTDDSGQEATDLEVNDETYCNFDCDSCNNVKSCPYSESDEKPEDSEDEPEDLDDDEQDEEVSDEDKYTCCKDMNCADCDPQECICRTCPNQLTCDEAFRYEPPSRKVNIERFNKVSEELQSLQNDKPSATIYEQSNSGKSVDELKRKDVEMIEDKNIRVELDQIGESKKIIDIFIDGEIPEESKIMINLTQKNSEGVLTSEVDITDIINKYLEK